jgi:[ribosomal protein S5]-alanine N-acetyltransferase
MKIPAPQDLPTLFGAQVKLRTPIERDKQDRLAAGRAPEFRRMVGGDPTDCPPLTLPEVEQWYQQLCRTPLHWVIEAEGCCIGVARLLAIDQTNRRARYAIGIFSPQFRGRGYGAETTQLILRYAFEKLGFHRIELRVLDFNHRAIACYRKCGFIEEGRERDSALIGGEWHSDVLMSVLEHEYRKQTRGL